MSKGCRLSKTPRNRLTVHHVITRQHGDGSVHQTIISTAQYVYMPLSEEPWVMRGNQKVPVARVGAGVYVAAYTLGERDGDPPGEVLQGTRYRVPPEPLHGREG